MLQVDRATAAVTDVATAALITTASTELIEPVLLSLLAVIGGDVAGLYRHDRDGWTVPVALVPRDAWSRLPFRRLPTVEAAALHPGIGLVTHVLHPQPVAITDLVADREWQQSELATLMRPDWGRNYQLMLPVYPAGDVRSCWVWVIGRARRDFTAADHGVGRAVLPVLEALTRHRISQQSRGGAGGGGSLTERELLVLQLLADGLRAVAIAAQLDVSQRTVHKHLERIYRKLGVGDRFHALQAGVRAGLLDTSEPALPLRVPATREA